MSLYAKQDILFPFSGKKGYLVLVSLVVISGQRQGRRWFHTELLQSPVNEVPLKDVVLASGVFVECFHLSLCFILILGFAAIPFDWPPGCMTDQTAEI